MHARFWVLQLLLGDAGAAAELHVLGWQVVARHTLLLVEPKMADMLHN